MRGKLTSRPSNAILREAERLVHSGVKELLIISQDTSAYGVDIKYGKKLWNNKEVRSHIVDLTRELGTLDAWIRLHYVYPYPHVRDLIPLMADKNNNVLSGDPKKIKKVYDTWKFSKDIRSKNLNWLLIDTQT